MIVLDLEANGLKPTKIHCVVALDTDEKSMRVFTEPTHLQDFLSGHKVVAHNGISYDFPVLDRLWNIRVPMRNQVDTLVLSRLAKPDRKGGHSLRAWGEHLGFKKGEYQDSWDEYSSTMLEYCKRDVLVCERLYYVVEEELQEFSEKSIQDEHMMQRLAHHVEENGFYFDVDTAEELYHTITSQESQIVDHMQEAFDPTVVQLKTKTKIIPFNPASRKQIGERLVAQGWKPTEFTDTGQPKVNETVLESIDIPAAKLLAKYFTLQKRSAALKSWIKATEEDNRVRCHYQTLGAVTNRMSCSGPNLQQIPSVRKPLGKECRALWKAQPGNVLLDTDAAGLELRVLAHYLDDPDFTSEILNGDVHTANQRMAGLDTRDQAKTFIYALLYGAGDAKIGTIVNGTAKDGRELRERFFANMPAFERFRNKVTEKGGKTQKLKAIDGRILHVRTEHASVNTLIQGSSAVLMKQWFMQTGINLKRRAPGCGIVAMVHDELVIECNPEQVDTASECVKISLSLVNEMYKMRCSLDCDIHYGNNWSEIH